MTTIAELKHPTAGQAMQARSASVGLTDTAGFELAQRAAKLMAASSLVPKEFQGNVPNCVIALNMAARLNADPLMVAQNLYVVHGRPSFSSQFLIATFNKNGRYSALRYEFRGNAGADEYACRAWAIEKATGDRLEGSWISLGMAKTEGWSTRNGSKWKTMPEQMLMYRAAAFFIRTYAPEISMGLHTAEELHDVYDAAPDDSGDYVVSAEAERIDTETGEVLDAPVPIDTLLAGIADSSTLDELAECEDMARGIDGRTADGKRVRDAIAARRSEL